MKINAIFNKDIKNLITCDIIRGKENKFYYVYKIIFPNGNYYIGLHRTNNLNDGYAGSGVLLHREYSRCNINDVKKEIILFCEDEKKLLEEEKRLIGDLYLTDSKCLNLVAGGTLGFSKKISEKSAEVRRGKKRSEESINKQRVTCTGKRHTEKTKEKQSEWHKSFWKTENSDKKREIIRKTMKERVHTEEERKKISETKKEYYKSDYGILKKYSLYYKEDLVDNNLYDFYNKCLEEAKSNTLLESNKDFFICFFKKIKKERRLKRYIESKKENKKYVFTNEHKKRISESKKGKKASEEVKKKFSELRSGRKNPKYSDDIIKMYDLDFNFLIEFKDCIDACDYVKKYINDKARTSDIFTACKYNKTRYGYRWQRFKK